MKDLKVALIVEALDRATAPLRAIGAGLHGVEERVERVAAAFHKIRGAEMIGGALAIGALAETGRATMELADKFGEVAEKIDKAHAATGLGVVQLQRWGFAARQVGVDTDSMNRAFGMMEFHVGAGISGNKQSIGALKLLGISLKEIRAMSNDPHAMVGRIMEGFAGVKNPLARITAGRDLFGKGWADVAPLLSAPQEDIQRFFAQIDRSGAEMSEKDLKTAADYRESKHVMGAAVDGLQKKLALGLMPALTATFDKITEWVENLKPADIQNFTDAVSGLMADLVQLLPTIEHVITGLVKLADWLAKAAKNTALMKVLVTALAVVMAAQVAVSLWSGAAAIAGVAIAALRAVYQIAILIPLVGSLSEVFGVFDLVLAANPIGLIVLGVSALAAAAYMVITNWTPIGQFFTNLLKGVGDAFSVAWKLISDLTPDWIKALFKLAGMGVALTVKGIESIAAPFMVPHSHAPSGAHSKAPWARGPGGQSSAPWALGGGGAPASYAGGPAAAGIIGTILIKAAPGTSVERMSSTGPFGFVHNRGTFEA